MSTTPDVPPAPPPTGQIAPQTPGSAVPPDGGAQQPPGHLPDPAGLSALASTLPQALFPAGEPALGNSASAEVEPREQPGRAPAQAGPVHGLPAQGQIPPGPTQPVEPVQIKSPFLAFVDRFVQRFMNSDEEARRGRWLMLLCCVALAIVCGTVITVLAITPVFGWTALAGGSGLGGTLLWRNQKRQPAPPRTTSPTPPEAPGAAPKRQRKPPKRATDAEPANGRPGGEVDDPPPRPTQETNE